MNTVLARPPGGDRLARIGVHGPTCSRRRLLARPGGEGPGSGLDVRGHAGAMELCRWAGAAGRA